MTYRRTAAAIGALSVTGLAFIAGKEGLRLDAYLDSGGVPTICMGSTEGVRLGQRATFAECNERLRRDTSKAGRRVESCTRVAITQGQYDALVSFEVNTGAYCASALARKLNAGDCHGAAREFNAAPQIDRATGLPRVHHGPPITYRGAVLLATGAPINKWTTAAGRPLPGLILRRAEERAVFEAGCERASS